MRVGLGHYMRGLWILWWLWNLLRKFKLSNQLLALQSEEHVCGDRKCGEECAWRCRENCWIFLGRHAKIETREEVFQAPSWRSGSRLPRCFRYVQSQHILANISIEWKCCINDNDWYSVVVCLALGVHHGVEFSCRVLQETKCNVQTDLRLEMLTLQ